MRALITYFIKYPVAVYIFIIAFCIFGFMGMKTLKSSFFPLTDSKIININIAYPGASPQEVEEGIVLQIEDNLKGLVGIDRITSISNENSGIITVETEKGVDIDVVLADVKNAVDRVPSFPTGMEPLVVSKQEQVRETVQFAINGENIPLKALKEIAQKIESDLRSIEGISQVVISGYPLEEIEIAVTEDKLLAYGLSFQDVAQAVSTNNILTTGGTIKTAEEDYLLRANGRNYYADEIENIVVRTQLDGTIIRLKDVAEVRDQFEDQPNASYYNGNLSVNVSVQNTNNEDLITSAQSIRDYMEKYNENNANVQLDLVNDSSTTVIERTELLTKNAIVGILLVIFFLSVFLNTRLAFWVALGLPISFFGMFIFAGFFGVTINVLSLFGMIIVIGILVDDGIVIAENIFHHYEKGKSPVKAAIDGTMEAIPPILSAVLTTMIAFSMFFFIDGRVGEFFGEVSIIVLLTLGVSLIEALIILPAHIAHSKALKKEDKSEKAKGFGDTVFGWLRGINKMGDRIMNFLRDKTYSPVLKFSLTHRLFTFSIFFAFLVLTFGSIAGGIIKGAFFPPIASDRVSINLKMPEGTNVAITDSIVSYVEENIWKVNDAYTSIQTDSLDVVSNVIKKLGPNSANASLSMNLLPGEKRDFTALVIANAVKDSVGTIYGVESLSFGSNSNFGGSPISVSFLGSNISELKAAKDELKVELGKIALLKDITDNDPDGIKEIKLKLNDNAYLLGLNNNLVMSQVRSGFFGFLAQRFQRGQDEIKVWVRYDKDYRSSIINLDEMLINTPSGAQVPMAEIATYTIERGEIAINHLNGVREIQINADINDPSQGTSAVQTEIQENIVPKILAKYPTITPLYEGQNREAGKFIGSAVVAGPIVLVLIYIVIAFTFRSFSQPLLLLALVPFSMIGVGWGHFFHGFPINILSFLGIIALIGIMVNDGLVLISKYNINLKEGMKVDDALFEAGKSRFRAIFLTSITTVAGLAPLIFETSRQAQFLIPMAISIAYGIGLATVLTLLLLPIFISFTNDFKRQAYWLWSGDPKTHEEVERAIIEIKSEADAEE